MGDLLETVVSLSKRRGFIFQSSEIYGGLKSAYDFGPLGVELKRNIAAEWWKAMVHKREDVVGIDASIMMHPRVWKASGHLATFTDPLVDCMVCKERFRADKAPKVAPGTEVEFGLKGNLKKGVVGPRGYVCPVCKSPNYSDERQFNLMFRTFIGPVDPIDAAVTALHGKNMSREEMRAVIEEALTPQSVYLRPETAQAMFVQFQNVQQTMSMKVPFGIAQQGKSFRNEITTEKFIFRTCEFEQMEMEFFVEPGTQAEWLKHWTDERLSWWRGLVNNPEGLRLRQHAKNELAHYADNCYDVEFQYPWGWDELEGIASRTDYDLKAHSKESGVKLSYFDQQKNDPETGKPGWRYTPYVIEPAAGLTRAVLMFLCDAYAEEERPDAEGVMKKRTVLKLSPRLAPFKAAVLPLFKKETMPELARKLASDLYKAGINASYDEQQSIGRRYARHDEIGTPYCLTVDHQSAVDGTVTIRSRDDASQERIALSNAVTVIRDKLRVE
jgi:glycyl-tRNA synthetase